MDILYFIFICVMVILVIVTLLWLWDYEALWRRERSRFNALLAQQYANISITPTNIPANVETIESNAIIAINISITPILNIN